MDNELAVAVEQALYEDVKKELWKKLGVFCGCLLLLCLLYKVTCGESTFFEMMEFAFPLAMMLYLPFKIGLYLSGSIIVGVIAAFLMVIGVGLLVGDNNLLLVAIFFGGCVCDFGSTIWRMRKLKKQMTEVVTDAEENNA